MKQFKDLSRDTQDKPDLIQSYWIMIYMAEIKSSSEAI